MEGEGNVARNGSSPDVEDITKTFIKTTTKDEPILRKVICRYGPGCTHILDINHREKVWHPRLQKLNDEQIKSHFICNECGYATNSLPDLQLHLKRKTAWSNASLIGCRINCLVDFKEWHEGYVTQFHKSGKHFVEFRMVNEKRWLVMKKVAFYIVERPSIQANDGSEFKDSTDGNVTVTEGLAPIEESWVFCEDISVDYAFAQSVLYKIYGNSLQETGHLTRGHVCLTDSDRSAAQHAKSSLLYGELLPRGANKAMGIKRLEAMRAESLFDLGMGTGKILIQAFLQFRNLRYIHGVELSAGRYRIAEEAAIHMVQLLGRENYQVQLNSGKFISITEAVRNPAFNESSPPADGNNSEEGEYIERVLHLQCGNMFDVTNIDTADVVMMETDIPQDLFPQLNRLLSRMKDGARVLTYIDLRRAWDMNQLPFRQLEINRHLSDRYPTSWSVQRGHHFYLWTRATSGYDQAAANASSVSSSSAWGFLSSHGGDSSQHNGGGQSASSHGRISSASSSPTKINNNNANYVNNNQVNASNARSGQISVNGSNHGNSRDNSTNSDDTQSSSRCLPSFVGSRSLAMRYFFGGSDGKGDRDRHFSTHYHSSNGNNSSKKTNGKSPPPVHIQAIPAPAPSASATNNTAVNSPRRNKSQENNNNSPKMNSSNSESGRDSPGPNSSQQNERVVIPINDNGSRTTGSPQLAFPSPSKFENGGSLTNSPRTPSQQALSPPVTVASTVKETGTDANRTGSHRGTKGSGSFQPVESSSSLSNINTSSPVKSAGVLDIAELPIGGSEDNGKPVAAVDVSNDIRALIRSSPIPPDGVGSRNSSQNSSNKSLPVNGNNGKASIATVNDGNEVVEDGVGKVKLITAYEAKNSGHSHHNRHRNDLARGSNRKHGQPASPTLPENATPEMAHNIAAVSKGVPSAAANAQKLRQLEALNNRLDEQVVSELSLSTPDPRANNAGGGDGNACIIS